MLPASFPDWKKIGKDIGKKLRDVIDPPSESGPSREERRDQRLADVLKGFAYFDDFDEVAGWRPEEVDSVQRANVPLLQRSGSAPNDSQHPTSRILLCHDYKGGYHDYESVRPPLLEQEMYFANYLQYVDIFVYFSHKLVCCPPPTWTNTLHRNGVKVLGTFIVEPGKSDIERMLEVKDGENLLAAQLANMAETFGFDGWLLNIEKCFPISTQDPKQELLAFIHELRRLLEPEKMVFWYDALTSENKVDYQNGLSLRNWEFAFAAGALFTNYKWTETQLENAKIIAQWHSLALEDIYFGIDMWAQNTNMPGPKRVTYPKHGGGGTLTGLAVNTLANQRFSSAIFAPAWTYEHFPGAGTRTIASQVDRTVWEGTTLPDELNCDCRKGKPHHQEDYYQYPIIDSGRESSAGSGHFFNADFTSPFEALRDRQGSQKLSSRIGAMWPQPCGTQPLSSTWIDVTDSMRPLRLSGRFVSDEDSHGVKVLGSRKSHFQISLEHESQQAGAETGRTIELPKMELLRFPLFKLDMQLNNELEARVICKRPLTSSVRAGCYMEFQVASGHIVYKYTKILRDESRKPDNIPVLMVPHTEARLIGFGAFCVIPNKDPKIPVGPVLDFYHLSIATPQQSNEVGSVHNTRLVQRRSGQHSESRLAWSWSFPQEQWSPAYPWSKTTGPYERFEVEMDGTILGDAYSNEFPLQGSEYSKLAKNGEIQLRIRGLLFGGGIAESSGSLDVAGTDCYIS